MNKITLHKLPDTKYGEKQWCVGNKPFVVTRWDFDCPSVSHCYRVTHISSPKRTLFEGDTLAEVREWFLDQANPTVD